MSGNILGDPETKKIDKRRVRGLCGCEDSLAYKVHGIERHFHSWARWFAAALVPSGEEHVADGIMDNQTPFSIVSGADTFGPWVQILGSTDTPVDVGNVEYDPHKILITTPQHSGAIYIIQLAFGPTAQAAMEKRDFTTTLLATSVGHVGQGLLVTPQTPRLRVGTKAWARTWAIGLASGTLEFYFGIHEYEG